MISSRLFETMGDFRDRTRAFIRNPKGLMINAAGKADAFSLALRTRAFGNIVFFEQTLEPP